MPAAFELQVQEILNRVFDTAANQLAATGAGSGGAQAQRSEQEIFDRVFVSGTNRIRVG